MRFVPVTICKTNPIAIENVLVPRFMWEIWKCVLPLENFHTFFYTFTLHVHITSKWTWINMMMHNHSIYKCPQKNDSLETIITNLQRGFVLIVPWSNNGCHHIKIRLWLSYIFRALQVTQFTPQRLFKKHLHSTLAKSPTQNYYYFIWIRGCFWVWDKGGFFRSLNHLKWQE